MNLHSIKELEPYLKEADHVDTKSVESDCSLQEFAAGIVNYQPVWVKSLFALRGILAALLRLDHSPITASVSPENFPMKPGELALFFTVCHAVPERLWIGEIKDTHLNAWIAITAEPGSQHKWRYHVTTIVHYNRWTGPVYFNVIRPFHHLIVGAAARSAA